MTGCSLYLTDREAVSSSIQEALDADRNISERIGNLVRIDQCEYIKL